MTAHAQADPSELVATARRLVTTADAATRFVWARAATHLVRQALEAGLDELWSTKAPGVAHVGMRNQLICLPFYLEGDLAQRVTWAWYATSEASHHQGFEFAPTAGDLLAWTEVVEKLVMTVRLRPTSE